MILSFCLVHFVWSEREREEKKSKRTNRSLIYLSLSYLVYLRAIKECVPKGLAATVYCVPFFLSKSFFWSRDWLVNCEANAILILYAYDDSDDDGRVQT